MKIDKHFKPEIVASKDQERPSIHEPYLNVKEEKLYATDGQMLVAIPVEVEKGERSRYLAIPLLKAARSLGDPAEPAIIEGEEIKPFGVLWPLEEMGKTFPDVAPVIPKFHPGSAGTITIGLNAAKLKKLADALGTGGPVRITMETGDTLGPLLITVEDGDEFGVLMPMRATLEGEEGAGQKCPKCSKMLAAGAFCPDHGDPLAEAAADKILREAGDGDMTKAGLKGPAVAHVPKKKG